MSTDEQARHWPHPVVAGTDLLDARFVTHTFGRHRHAQYAFGVITEGVEDFDYRGALHHAGPGSVVMVDAESVHTGQPGIDGGWRYQMIYVDADFVAAVARELGGGRPSFPRALVRDPQTAAALLGAHAAAAGDGRLVASETLRDAVTLLVGRHGRPNVSATAPPDPGAALVRRSAELLRERLINPPSVDELAEFAGCGPFALIRAFRRHVGMPPHAYLTQCRIDQARALLGTGGDVASTAFAVGFADQAHLTRTFRRYVGVPPARYARERRIVQESGLLAT